MDSSSFSLYAFLCICVAGEIGVGAESVDLRYSGGGGQETQESQSILNGCSKETALCK